MTLESVRRSHRLASLAEVSVVEKHLRRQVPGRPVVEPGRSQVVRRAVKRRVEANLRETENTGRLRAPDEIPDTGSRAPARSQGRMWPPGAGGPGPASRGKARAAGCATSVETRWKRVDCSSAAERRRPTRARRSKRRDDVRRAPAGVASPSTCRQELPREPPGCALSIICVDSRASVPAPDESFGTTRSGAARRVRRPARVRGSAAGLDRRGAYPAGRHARRLDGIAGAPARAPAGPVHVLASRVVRSADAGLVDLLR